MFFALVATLAVVSCKPSVPSRYIQPDDMEDLLVDYHIAQAMAEQGMKNQDERNYDQTLYFASVLEKHGVTKADFDSSLVYYYVRADRFADIYRNVAERLSHQALELGASEGEVNRFANLSSSGDTINVWAGHLSAILLPYPPYHLFSFEQKADTSFRKSDAFMFILNSDFMYQSGMRSAEACISIRYDNDTVVSRTTGMSSTGINQIRVPALDGHMAREIRGYVYLTPEKETSPSMKMMVIRNIQLIKFRKKEEPKTTVVEDSLKTKKLE